MSGQGLPRFPLQRPSTSRRERRALWAIRSAALQNKATIRGCEPVSTNNMSTAGLDGLALAALITLALPLLQFCEAMGKMEP